MSEALKAAEGSCQHVSLSLRGNVRGPECPARHAPNIAEIRRHGAAGCKKESGLVYFTVSAAIRTSVALTVFLPA